MATSMAHTPPESYWNEQSQTLRRVQDKRTGSREPPSRSKQQPPPKATFQPLSDEHPLLQGTADNQSSKSPRTHRTSPHRLTNGAMSTPPLPRGRHSRTPPSRLPRMHTPPDHRHEARVRGARFGVLPHVRNPPNGYHNGYDSWGEDAETESDEDYETYPPQADPRGFPYPVVMYPMMVPQPQRRKTKDKGKKKRVRYKASPVLLNSRENTLHEPLAIHDAYSTFAYDDDERYRYNTYDGGGGGPGGAGGGGFSNSPRFSYISTAGGHKYNPFDPRMNPILARYQVGGDPVTSDTPYVRHRPPFSRDRTPNYDTQPGLPAAQINSLEKWLSEVVEEVVCEGSTEVVRDTMLEMVDSHLEKAAVYDIAVDIMNETIELEAPEMISDILADMFLEELLEDEVIEPEIEDFTKDIVTEVCTNYNDRRRRQDLKLVKRDTGDRLLDGLTLDYLLALSARQGKIWTEGEHANKLFDSMILNTLLAQLMDVSKKRRSNIMGKPIRRHHEKIVTDVATDVVLEELCKTLDEDIADLDEYEMGMENSDRKQKFSPLEKWIRGS